MASGRSCPQPAAPSLTDPLVAAMSEPVGGPAGRHGLPHRWWTPVRVLLAGFAVVFALGLVQKAPCINDHWNSNNVRYSKMCYSDIPYLYTGRGFAEHRWPYAGSHGRYPAMEYPVGISYLAWAASEVTALAPEGPPMVARIAVAPSQLWGLPGMDREINENFLITALMLCGFGLLATYFLAGAHRGRPWDAMGFVLSPMLLLAGLINWDLMAVALVAGALWAWARGRSFWAGVFVGLGIATKLYPVFLLGAFFVVCLRRRDWRPALLSALGAMVAWASVNLPAMLTGLSQWKMFWTFNTRRQADLGSIWYLLELKHHTFSAHEINLVSWTFLVVAGAVVLALGLTAPRPPRVAQLGFLLVAAFLLVNKVYSPQYVLWLLPLAALARPRWRDLLIWQACELAYFAAVWLFLGGWLEDSTGTSSPAYQLAIVVRMIGQIYLMLVVTRDILVPELDPVRGPDGEDQMTSVGPGLARTSG